MTTTTKPTVSAETAALPALPPELDGWTWRTHCMRASATGPLQDHYALQEPGSDWTTNTYQKPDRAVAEARRRLQSTPKPPAAGAALAPRPVAAEAVVMMEPPPPTARDAAAPAPILVDLAEIADNPFQPRLAYDAERITAIAASIQQHGLLQVPLARRVGRDRYELAFGHSRLRAFAQLAEQDAVRFGRMPLVVRDLDDETMALHAWIENRDRKDLSSYEEAKAIERYTATFGWSQKQAAEKLQLDRATVANKLRLLKLPEAALKQLQAGELSERQAMALLPLADLPAATLKRAESGYGYKPSQVIAGASKHSSNDLRDQVDSILRNVTVELKVDWRDVDFGDLNGTQSARCADCALRTRERCAGPTCFQIKRAAWQQRRLEQASAKLGVPALAKEPSYNAMEGSFGGFGEQIVAAGCEKLRLVAGGYTGQRARGFPELRIICAHGQGKKCSCALKLQRAAAQTDPTKIAERERKKESSALISQATAALAAALASGNPKAWRKALRAVRYEYREETTEGWDLPTIQGAIASALVKGACYYNDERPELVREHVGKLLTFCDLPLPWEAAQSAPDVCAQTPEQEVEA